MRKLLALFLVVVFVFPLILAALTLLSVNSWVLDRGFYENLLGDVRLYQVLLSEDIPTYMSSRRPVKEADMIPANALGNALRQVVTPEDLRSQSLRMVNDMFDFLDGRTATLDLYLDTTQIKTALQGDGAQKFARALASSLPICTSGQEPIASGGVLMRCLSSDKSVDQATQDIVNALPAFFSDVPDRIDLQRDVINFRMRGTPFAAGFFSNSLGVATGILIAFAAGMWLTAALIADDRSRTRLLWLGWSLIVPAALVFLIGLAVSSPISLGWARFGLNQAHWSDGAAFSPEFREAILSVTGTTLQTIANGFLMVGAASGAIAIGLIVWGSMTPAGRYVVPPSVSQPPVNQGSGDQGSVSQGTVSQGSGDQGSASQGSGNSIS